MRPSRKQGMLLIYVFQSTHPQGMRRLVSQTQKETLLFQSTHPQGMRRKHMTQLWMHSKFQSTHPQGMRLNIETIAALCHISIHASARDATAIID